VSAAGSSCPFPILPISILTLELLLLEGDVMLGKCILQEMISKALDLDIGDVL
jgi:hypothetical protein